MSSIKIVLGLLLCGVLGFLISPTTGTPINPVKIGRQQWGYVEVRPGAHMFWWLYYASGVKDYTKRPWVIWLQGGPGASSSGFGNLGEIGPVDSALNNRTHHWVQEANVLFIDNPVGTGFSYVTNDSLLATNNSQIAADLLVAITRFLEKVPDFQAIPLHIFGESYGGKMAAQFALRLYKQISKGKLKCNLKSVNLGDSWISPIDSVLTWAPFLFSTSLVDNRGFNAVNKSAYAVREAVERGQYKEATALFDQTLNVVAKITNKVSIYNILKTDTIEITTTPEKVTATENPENPDYNSVGSIVEDMLLKKYLYYSGNNKVSSSEVKVVDTEDDVMTRIARKHLQPYQMQTLYDIMNGVVKQTMNIIPKNVTWQADNTKVFNALSEDFMKPVVHVVENLLNNTPIAVNVYNGQLDLVVDTMGTLNWAESLSWSGIQGWSKAERKSIVLNNSTEMFVTKYKNFGFYWILKAGHMVPTDAPETALELLKLVTSDK